jgi:hypothetical protein
MALWSRLFAETAVAENKQMPPPDPIWIALGIVIWALAEALGEKRRPQFIAALERIAADHSARGKIVSLHINGRRRSVAASAKVASNYITRIVGEMRAAYR